MLKNIKYILASISAVLIVASCEDFLNTPPAGDLDSEGYYSTPSTIEHGVRGAYSLLRDVELHQYITFSEDRSDNVWVDPAPNGVRTCSEISYYRVSSSTEDIGTLWTSWYELINNANTVLEAIPNVEFDDESIRDQFRGELLFLRALAHFEMARTYGNIPVADHVLTLSEAQSNKQVEASEVMNDYVIPDLLEAEELLPYEDGMLDSGGSSIAITEGRANRAAVQALLARIYMTLKGYPYYDSNASASAKTYLEKVLDYSSENADKYWAPTIEDWQRQFMTEPSIANTYQIFSVQNRVGNSQSFSGSTGVALSDEFFPNGLNNSAYNNGGEMTPIYPEASLWYEYTVNNDPRGFDFSFIDGYDEYGQTPAYSNVLITIEYNGESVQAYEQSINTKWIPYASKREALGISFDDNTLGRWPINFPVLRLEDMMLLYAEILVEEGNITEAMGYVNKIRERAGITLRETNVSSDQAMEYIKMERKLEFYLEGVRWFDQVRYGEWIETTLEKYERYYINGEPRSGVSISNVYGERYYLPIPFAEMQAVPGLYTQNADWN